MTVKEKIELKISIIDANDIGANASLQMELYDFNELITFNGGNPNDYSFYR